MGLDLMNTKVKCFCCGKEEKAINIRRAWVTMDDGKKLQLSFYRCKECNRIMIVQLDDEYTNELLDKIQEGIMYAYECKKSGRTPKKKKSRMFLKLNKKLTNYRKNLNKEYEGCMVGICGEDVEIKIEMKEE